MIDIKRYKESDGTVVPTAPVVPVLKHTAQESQSDPPVFQAKVQIDLGTNIVALSNMGLDASAGDDKMVQHFCVDCCMPFRQDRMVRFRGLWYGIPCGDHRHAVDIFRKERERAFLPPRHNEPGEVPFVSSANF